MNCIHHLDGTHEDTANNTFTHWQEWVGGALLGASPLRRNGL